MKMRKIVAALMVVMMLCCIIPFSAAADGTSATISFADVANRVSCSGEQQVWKQNGITVTNNQGASTSPVNEKYFNPVRFYKNSDVIVEYAGMTLIEFTCNTASYATTLAGAIDGAVADGAVVSVALDGVDSFSCTMSGGQVRVDSITVYTGDAPVEPDEPEVPAGDPEADTELSIADAIALGLSKEHNTYTEGKYFVTGVITEVYNTQYGNMYITDGENTLLIYGTYSEDGSTRYDAMDVQPAAGDTVTIYGPIGQYNGTAQIKNGWIVEHVVGETPDVPVEPDEPASDLVLIDTPVAGVAYKFGMIQGNVSATDVYYLIGGMAQTYYMATGTDVAAAIDVYLEETTGGYYLYAMVDGAKTYINMVVSTTHVNGAYSATPSTVYTYDADAKTVVAMMQPDGVEAPAAYWFGTRNDKTYTTVGPCAVEYAGFYCQFYGAAVTPDEPDVPAEDTLTIEQAIALGQTMEHNTFTEQKYYVTGVITEVYNTMYGNMKLTDDKGNILTIYGTYSADGSARYDAMDIQPVAGDTVTIYGIVGQYNGNSQVKNGWIVAHTAAGGETPDEPDVPDEPETPDEPSEPSVGIVTNPVAGVAYKLGLDQLNKGATYYFTGAMNGYYGATDTDVANAVDMYVEIVDGGYKLYFNDASGAKQYIKLEQSGTHYNFTFGAEGSVFTLDAEKNAFCAPAGDQICYMGTYGDYFTVGTLTSEKLKDSDYIARLYAVETPVDPENPDEPGTDSPTTGDNSSVYVTLAVVLVVLSAAALVVTKKRA